MGNWNMTVIGTGCHHNRSRDGKWRAGNDADEQFRLFVESLKKSGHTITHASFTHGGAEDITNLPLTAESFAQGTDPES